MCVRRGRPEEERSSSASGPDQRNFLAEYRTVLAAGIWQVLDSYTFGTQTGRVLLGVCRLSNVGVRGTG